MRAFAIICAVMMTVCVFGGCKAWDMSDPFHPQHGNRNSLDGCEPCVRCNDCCPCDNGCSPSCDGQTKGPGY